jgi:hypothetical protein
VGGVCADGLDTELQGVCDFRMGLANCASIVLRSSTSTWCNVSKQAAETWAFQTYRATACS